LYGILFCYTPKMKNAGRNHSLVVTLSRVASWFRFTHRGATLCKAERVFFFSFCVLRDGNDNDRRIHTKTTRRLFCHRCSLPY
jgi:hypothetical protein